MSRSLITFSLACLSIGTGCFADDSFYDNSSPIQRVYAHLLLKDPQAALEEIESALRSNPDSLPLLKAKLEVLATLGDATPLLNTWRRYIALFPDEVSNRELLETMGWGVIAKGSRSPALATRAMALIGAHLGNDARGVSILAEGLRSPNALLRGISVEIAGQMRDDRLREEIASMLRTERVWAVRLEVLRAVGRMRIHSAAGHLEALLNDPSTRAEEKAVAVQSLMALVDEADEKKIQDLVQSNRSGLRELACLLVSQQEDEALVNLLIPLLSDHNPKLRTLALQAMGALTTPSTLTAEIKAAVEQRLSDEDPMTSLTAAWMLTPLDTNVTMPIFRQWLAHPSREVQRTASGVLAATGTHGLSQMRYVVRTHPDGYVRANVAMGLLGLRDDLPQACTTLTAALRDLPERWMWRENGIFRCLCPSDLKHKEGTPNYPEVMNQIVRLEFLNAIAMVHSPSALEAMKQFLQERTWGIAGIAASLLLSEGDESTFTLVRELLKDPVRRVRAQAALVLAMWGHDAESVDTLQGLYKEADFTLKGMILEALGNVGHEKSIPFLIATLEEPSEQVRLIAATSLIRCLNH